MEKEIAVKDIATELNRSYKSVYRKIRNNNLKFTYSGWTKEMNDNLKEMLEQGMNYSEIEATGVIGHSAGTINSHAKRRGLKPNFENRKCKECDNRTKRQDSRAQLCADCLRQKARIREKNKRHIKDLRKRERARSNGKYDSDITLRKLYKKDKGICHICNKECDTKDYMHNDNNIFIVGRNYPTTDHVIPIAKGGEHSWDNVKLAHHYCNTMKTDTLMADLVL